MAEGRKTPMPARRKARKRALDVLYEADLRDVPIQATLASALGRIEPPRAGPPAYAVVAGRGRRRAPRPDRRADRRPTPRAGRWTGCRSSTATWPGSRVYELLYVDDIDDAVAITEAVELAKQLSTDDSPRFLNGVLGRIADYTAALSSTTPAEHDNGRDPSRGAAVVYGCGQALEHRPEVVGDQDAVLVEALDQGGRREVVDDRERAQVVGADRQHPAVVVAALLLDGARVLGDEQQVVVGLVVELLQVEHDLAGRLVAHAACPRAAVRRPAPGRSRPARPGATR